MKASFKRKSIQYSGLRRMIAGLKEIASGEVVARALGRFQEYLAGRVKGELARHVWTGKALGTARVELASSAVEITLQRYRRYIKWSFRKGVPLSALKRGQKIISEELASALRGGARALAPSGSEPSQSPGGRKRGDKGRFIK